MSIRQRVRGHRDAGSGNVGISPSRFRTTPATFRPRRLVGPVPSHFEDFYRLNVRFVPNARVRSSDLIELYCAWAAAVGAPSLNAREIIQAMRNIGHRRKRSNGIRYCDAALAANYPNLPDNFPEMVSQESLIAAIADRLDSIVTELISIRAQVAGPETNGQGPY